jgi:predicted kinase
LDPRRPRGNPTACGSLTPRLWGRTVEVECPLDVMTATLKLVVLAGLPGSGKSTLARPIARRLEALWLRIDTLEASILKAGISRSFETGLAAYVGACDLASDNLKLGRSVVIDAVNGVGEARKMWQDLSRDSGAARYVIHVTCPNLEEHRRRVESRPSPTPPLPPLTWEEVQHREFEPWNEEVLVVDSMKPLQENVDRILAYCSPKPLGRPSLSTQELQDQRLFGGE